MTAPTPKPLLRGWVHAVGALALAGAAPALLARCATGAQALWVACYLAGVGSMLVVSALFHRVWWSERAFAAWRRADLAAIFAAIAGSGVAVAGLTLSPGERWALVGAVAGAGLVGLALARALPARWGAATYYLLVGWAAAAFLPAIAAGGGAACAALVGAGGVAYSAGAVAYAARRPRLAPRVFGFHELFHACTLLGAGLHYGALWAALSR